MAQTLAHKRDFDHGGGARGRRGAAGARGRFPRDLDVNEYARKMKPADKALRFAISHARPYFARILDEVGKELAVVANVVDNGLEPGCTIEAIAAELPP